MEDIVNDIKIAISESSFTNGNFKLFFYTNKNKEIIWKRISSEGVPPFAEEVLSEEDILDMCNKFPVEEKKFYVQELAPCPDGYVFEYEGRDGIKRIGIDKGTKNIPINHPDFPSFKECLLYFNNIEKKEENSYRIRVLIKYSKDSELGWEIYNTNIIQEPLRKRF